MSNLSVRNLVVVRGGRIILDSCNAEFSSGRRTVLWGRSGSGKSTLLTTIAGLTPAQSGTIQMGQQVFFSEEERIDIAPHQRQVGFVFQDLALWPHLTALEHVFLVGRPVGLDRPGGLRLLQSVGLDGLSHRRPGELSGGEQQRLAIARALSGKPATLLLDEPFSSLDRRTKDSLYKLLREVSPLVPGPTIYVTHHEDDAIELAEGVITLSRGKLAASDRPWDRSE